MTSPERLTTSSAEDPWAQDKGPSPKSGSFQIAATPGTRLAQEIHDEFLVCKICLEGYKNPKSLNCLHTFCEGCIENHVLSESSYKKYTDYREFTCPLCRKRTQLPIGGVKKLPDNFLVSSLSEVVQRQKPSKFPFCDICKMVSHKHREAQSKCLDCAKLLCSQCVDMHRDTKVTSNHSIFDVEIEKDIECREHEDEVVRFYCEPCETCICVLCTFNEHKDHQISQFGEAVVKYKENIQVMLDQCKQKVVTFDGQVESLSKCEDVIKGVQQLIHDTALEFVQEIRNREKSLIEEIENIYGLEIMELIENKKDLCTQAESLRSTCNLTEVILTGKDIELLLLKKDVQQKLTHLNSIELKKPPATVSKIVNFIPGATDLGYIHDLDRPLLTKMRLPRNGSNNDMGSVVQLSNRMVQTEEKGRCRTTSKAITSEEDDSDDDESDSDSDEDTPEMVDFGVQTVIESSSSESESEDSGPETTENSTMTDQITTEEKGVNTRSRSLQNVSSTGHSSPARDEDNSLAARRRRRRERAQNATLGNSYSVDDDYSDRRKRGSGYYKNHSLDHDDVFYDAEGLGPRV